MKKWVSIALALAFSVSLFLFTGLSANAASDTGARIYNIPLRAEPPIVDGKGDDAAWDGACTVEMSIAALKGDGYIKYISKSEGATGTVKMVWSNKSGREGLYFLCDVNDPTNGWAVDILGDGPYYEDLGDGIQIFIDPLYKRASTIKNTAMRFNFVPYTCQSGNGMCPIFPESWWESWIWVGHQATSGVELKASLDSVADDYREKIVKAYTMEIFIPWKALQLNYEEPPAGNLGDKMGIGLALHDTDWSKELYDEACYSTGVFVWNPSPSILDVNYITDFSKNGKLAIQYPRYYNTLVLANADGTDPNKKDEDEGPDNTTDDNQQTTDNSEKNTAFDALTSSIDKAKQEYLENDTEREKYTDESLNALSEAVTKALEMSDTNTVEEINAAKEAVETAISGLVQKEDNSVRMLIYRQNIDDENKTDDKVEQKDGLSTAAIIGIIAGAVILAAVIIVIIIVVKKKSKGAGESKQDTPVDELNTDTSTETNVAESDEDSTDTEK